MTRTSLLACVAAAFLFVGCGNERKPADVAKASAVPAGRADVAIELDSTSVTAAEGAPESQAPSSPPTQAAAPESDVAAMAESDFGSPSTRVFAVSYGGASARDASRTEDGHRVFQRDVYASHYAPASNLPFAVVFQIPASANGGTLMMGKEESTLSW